MPCEVSCRRTRCARRASIRRPALRPWRPRNSRCLRTRPSGYSLATSGSREPLMSGYRRILLVVDLAEDSLHVGRRAQAIATLSGAEIELLHVVEFVPVEPMGETLMPAVQIEEELLQRARHRLATLAAELGVPEARCRVEAGNIKSEIVRIARERNADLIVLGSRERHGL